jgi:hypothetical protein
MSMSSGFLVVLVFTAGLAFSGYVGAEKRTTYTIPEGKALRCDLVDK